MSDVIRLVREALLDLRVGAVRADVSEVPEPVALQVRNQVIASLNSAVLTSL